MATNFNTDQAIVDSVKFANLIKNTYKRSSLTRNAKDTVAQYPVIFSADVPTDDAVVIAKSLEQQYAALLISVISANSDYDRSRFSNPSEYLKSFYNNANVPTILMAVDSQMNGALMDCDQFAIETAVSVVNADKLVPELGMECWIDSGAQFNQNSLNASYRPERATQKVMESVIENLRKIHMPAMEAPIDEVLGGMYANTTNKDSVGAPTKADKTERTIERGRIQRDEDGNVIKDAKGRPMTENVTKENKLTRAPAATGRAGLMSGFDRLGSMAPTMIDVQLTSHHGNAPVITHNVIVGVKAMARSIPQDLMISNLAEGVNDTRNMFKFIKWTEGEYKFLWDFVLGVQNAKAQAASNRDMQHWLKGLQRRKRSDLLNKMGHGMAMPPMTTIVTTSYEVARVAELTGLDLNDSFNAAKLISKYYLLGFVIYESETAKIKAIFDGDTNFSVSTIAGLKSKQQKDTDLTQYAQFIRAAGRM